MRRVAVDVDGTLTKGKKRYWREECEPDKEMIEAVNDIYKAGHTVIIWTARPWGNAYKLAAWLQKYGVRYHGVRMDKGSADVYIDDKTIRPGEVKGAQSPAEDLIDNWSRDNQ